MGGWEANLWTPLQLEDQDPPRTPTWLMGSELGPTITLLLESHRLEVFKGSTSLDAGSKIAPLLGHDWGKDPLSGELGNSYFTCFIH